MSRACLAPLLSLLATGCSIDFVAALGAMGAPQDAGFAQDSTVTLDAGAAPDAGPALDAGHADAGPGPAERCAAEPLAGPVRYFCDCAVGASAACVPGDDANPGDSPASPRRTFASARSTTLEMAPGTTLAFCRGGSFGVDKYLEPPACEVGRPCTFRDYAPTWGLGSSEPAPLLTASGMVFLLASGGRGYRLLNLALRGPGGAKGSDDGAVLVFDGTSDVEVCNLEIRGFRIAVNVEQGPRGPCDRVAVRGVRTGDLGAYSFIGGSPDLVLEGSHLAGVLSLGGAPRQQVRDNVISLDGPCSGEAVYVSSPQDALRFEGNTVRVAAVAAGRCEGMQLKGGDGASHAGTQIRRNRFLGVTHGVRVAWCPDCAIEDNLIVVVPGNSSVGIDAAWTTQGASDNAVTTGMKVRHNTVFFGPGSSGLGIHVGREGTGHVVANNAVAYAGNGDWACFGLDLPATAYAFSDSNLCWFPGAAPGAWAQGKGDLAAWRASSGLDGASLVADPRFRDPASPAWDFRPGPSSPLIDAANPGRATATDLDGVARQVPDIGALEQ